MSADHEISRRTMLETLGVLGIAATTGLSVSRPGPAHAQALGGQETVQDGLARLFGARAIKDGWTERSVASVVVSLVRAVSMFRWNCALADARERTVSASQSGRNSG